MTKPTGNPTGRPPGPRLRFKREVAACELLLAGALEETSEALVDLAKGLRVLQIIDGQGGYRALPAERARALVLDDRVVDAGLRSGQLRVYALPPDLSAIAMLHDRIMGKVPTQTELALKPALERVQLDHAILAKALVEHVPVQYLTPIIAELERLAAGGAPA